MLRLVAAALPTAEIADELGIGDATVKTHLSRVLAKHGLVSSTRAVVLAYESGLVGRGPGPGSPCNGVPPDW